MLPSFAKTPIMIVHPSLAEGDFGGRLDYETPDHVVATTGWINPTSSDTGTGQALKHSDDATVFLQPGTDITSMCRVDVEGQQWMVVDQPKTWNSPTGALDHIEVTVRRSGTSNGR